MKKVEIKGEINMLVPKGDGSIMKVGICNLLITIINTPKERGLTFEEIGARSLIIRKLQEAEKKHEDYIMLEDAEYKTMVDILKIYPFGMADPALHDWLTEITNLPDSAVKLAK